MLSLKQLIYFINIIDKVLLANDEENLNEICNREQKIKELFKISDDYLETSCKQLLKIAQSDNQEFLANTTNQTLLKNLQTKNKISNMNQQAQQMLHTNQIQTNQQKKIQQ
eukprot:TRINITY_DN6447_c0_g2_i1.p2 TRINITY_DN6447_c0_g2~~TRINITY_DN6447_c0_g2_i1.p2  ORF type:complete len:111 (-),score=20.49 TRINITY_DN6447_c0_g2_i1:55-387(-)